MSPVCPFCQTATGQCEGIAKFLMVWRKDRAGNWVMTRVISYGHRPWVKAGELGK